MKIKLWGVRGSIPTTGPDTHFYGGNTSCVSLTEDGCLLVLDGGSGMRQLSEDSHPAGKRIDILLTHLHMDHIQGLGFFKALFDSSMDVHLWGPASSSQTLHSRISRYLSPPLFPARIRDLPCRLQLHEIGNSRFETGPFHIQSNYVIHPGPTVGYRIKGRNAVFTYLPDHEPALGKNGIIHHSKWISGFDLAEGANLLLHDAQYTKEEYSQRKGWGHSSIEDAGEFASLTSVQHLLLSHHDPSHTDDFLDKMFEAFRNNSDFSYKTSIAKEGFEIELG